MKRLSIALFFTLSVALLGCITSPKDKTAGEGRMARGGVSPLFEMSGYLLNPNEDLVIQVLNHRTDRWDYLATARSSSEETLRLYPWKVRNLQILNPDHFDETRRSERVVLRALAQQGESTPQLVTFTEEAWECVERELNAGTSPIDAGIACRSGETVNLRWKLNGTNVSNHPLPCADIGVLHALDDENNHRLAVRLTPPSWPFEVRQLRYHLVTENDCERRLTHRVEVYVGRGDAPPESPAILRSFKRTPVAVLGERAELVDLEEPIVLNRGEHLFVSVQMKHKASGKRLCVPSCRIHGAYRAGRNWWSNAASPPYAWQELGEFGLSGMPRIAMSGKAL